MTTSPQETLSESRRLVEALLDMLPTATILVDPETMDLTFANRAADRLVGGRFPPGQERFGAGAGRFIPRDPRTGEPLPRERTPTYLAATTGERVDGQHLDLDGPDGCVSLVASAALLPQIGDMPPTVIASFEDVTPLSDARAAAEAAASRARFLAEASVLLDRTLDYDETLRSVARLAVPDIADLCSVDLLEQGLLRNVAVMHADPRKVELGERLMRDLPLPDDAPYGPPEVLRTGRSQLLREVTDDMLVASASGADQLEILRALALRSVMVVPMISRSRMLGTLTFASAESARRFGDDDVLLAENLARRAAVAIDNSRLYSERAHIARTLQESLLPPQLPAIPGLEVAARYVAAGDGIEVGGDFYDLFDLGGGWSVVIGDVCGKGPDAAAVTALARYTLRATAGQTTLPSQALAVLNDAVLRQRGDGRFITVAYAKLAAIGTPGDGLRVTLSCGGHPAPILRRADGSAEPVGHAGTLLGVVPDPVLADVSVDLRPGDALFLYTDGVTEAHAPDHILEAEDIAKLLEDCDGDAADLLSCVEDAVRSLGSGVPHDDVAMLTLRVPPNT
jgi:serine phosphatase RsbU (regulator of sigma subunit)